MRIARSILACVAVPAIAHELSATFQLAPPAVVVRAAYGGSEPVPFAKVQVFAPAAAAATEFQTGRTDRRGHFSFVPEGPGSWRVVIDDEEGHRRELAIHVPAPFNSVDQRQAPPHPLPDSRLDRALLGLALIAGATGVLYGVKARRRSG